MSITSRLRSDLNDLTQRLETLVQGLPIQELDRTGGVVMIAPDYYWGNPSEEQMSSQLAIKRDYEEWFEVFYSVFAKAPKNLNRKIKEADQSCRKWIELSQNWFLQPDPSANVKRLRHDVKLFSDLLAIIEASGPMPPVLIPDTNAIAIEPDPTRYRAVIADDSFFFLLLPTVLSELDELKNNHRNPEFRGKVKKVITRIKGWRQQGSLLKGVTVDKSITVKALATEPDMLNTLTRLDRENRDDRIIARVLEVQSSYPNAQVILVTGDINLSNKADLARIETAGQVID